MEAGPDFELVLGSASPRRRELLAGVGLAPPVVPADVDESVVGRPAPEVAAVDIARRKARALAASRVGAAVVVLCADTVVGVQDEDGWTLLGKPSDRDEARRMLQRLSGSTQVVSTGLCVARCSDGALFDDVESTHVTMRPLGPDEIDAYLDSGEWRDKAGAYGIQGRADAFVVGLSGGGFDNVVGLPVERALALLERAGYRHLPDRVHEQ
ncbi:Maf-like protein YhdE [Planctomycetes bacterium Pla163]|uniref:dTTP/UTP pyrophosphatase n=1 Tax=Rohdeia mirabilis TaxID=2528008 RepID=A0A518D108_9BACT|nr:Maf-like protein YhdE [Planctomycetes bacterium Pla163]